MVGQTLGNRYEILEEVGGGGMALVYCARDILLNRKVAVKILRPQFALDEGFVSRFRKEAQAAASLSHPNVVNIYDVGKMETTHFIVMEYVEGQNLKQIIQERAPLEQSFIVDIGRQIGQALAHAHQHKLIHCDIKPHNILVTPDGVVKVTDFGIARAMAKSQLTQTGMVLGSVHYFSPEQASGKPVQNQSDLYSLGIVLYEMTCGSVPFTGDTPIAVALKQLQSPPQRLQQLRVDVLPRLEVLVMQLLAKEESKRYGNADAVISELIEIGRELEQQGKVETEPQEDEGPKSDEELKLLDRKEQRRQRRQARKRKLLILLVVLGMVAGSGFTVYQLLPQVLFGDETVVPDVVGLPFFEAQRVLQEAGLGVRQTTEVYHNQIPAGQVTFQDVLAGRTVKTNRVIEVHISRGPEIVSMPDVIGKSLRDARLMLTQAGLTLGNESERFAPELPLHTIVDQQPAALTDVTKGSAVDLVINKGMETPETVVMPDFRGANLNDVELSLEAIGLELGNTWPEFSTTVPSGQIIEQNPDPGADVEYGWVVDFVVSQGLPQQPSEAQARETTEEIQHWTAASAWASLEVTISVPTGPSQEVVIIVIDDFGAREVFRQVADGGSRLVRTVQGRGEEAKIQVYIGGRMYLDRKFRE